MQTHPQHVACRRLMAVCRSSVLQAVDILLSRAHMGVLRARFAAWRPWAARRAGQRTLVSSAC